MKFMNNKCVKTQYLRVEPYVQCRIGIPAIIFENEKYSVVGTYEDIKDLQDSITRQGLNSVHTILKIEGLSRADVKVNITLDNNNK